jgi:hypothetical protein
VLVYSLYFLYYHHMRNVVRIKIQFVQILINKIVPPLISLEHKNLNTFSRKYTVKFDILKCKLKFIIYYHNNFLIFVIFVGCFTIRDKKK